jgi:hypothetical protein
MTRNSIVLSIVVATVTTVGVLFLVLTLNDSTLTLPVRATSVVESNHRVAPRSPTPGPRELLGEPLPQDSETPSAQPEHAAVVGRVVGPDDAPVCGALINLAADRSIVEGSSIEGEVEQTTTTDDDGRFDLSSVHGSCRYVLRVEQEGFASRSLNAVTVANGERVEVKIRLDRGGTLLGRVVDSNGRAPGEVEVVVLDLSRQSDEPEQNVESVTLCAVDGEYRVEHLSAGLKRVAVSAVGYASTALDLVKVVEGEETELSDFVLYPSARIFGRTIDAFDGSSLEGVRISAHPVSRDNRGIVLGNYLAIESDADGRFNYEGLAVGPHQLSFHREGYGRVKSTHMVGDDEEVTVELLRLPSIHGSVVDAATGGAIEEFTLVLSLSERLPFGGDAAGRKLSDPEGRFEYVDPYLSGDFHLLALAAGYSTGCSEAINLENGQDADGVVIRMHRRIRLRGRVTDAGGNVISGATVRLSPRLHDEANETSELFRLVLSRAAMGVRRDEQTTQSDADGFFEFENVSEGRHSILVKHPDFAPKETVEAVTRPRSGDVLLPDMKLLQGGTLKGVIVSEDGEPVGGATVEVFGEVNIDGSDSHRVRTRKDGRFEFSQLSSGRYGLQIAAARSNGDGSDNQANFHLIERALARHVSEEFTLTNGQVLELRFVW